MPDPIETAVKASSDAKIDPSAPAVAMLALAVYGGMSAVHDVVTLGVKINRNRKVKKALKEEQNRPVL